MSTGGAGPGRVLSGREDSTRAAPPGYYSRTVSRLPLLPRLTPVTLVVSAVAVMVLLAAGFVGLATVHAPTRAAAAPRPVAAVPVTPSTTPAPPPPVTVTPAPTSPAPAAATPQLGRDHVRIPSQHVTAPVDVCEIVDGALEPPADVHRTCLWAGGAALSAHEGTTVITGHVNWVGQGTGALGNIYRLHAGNIVYTSAGRGTVTRWRVTSVVHRPKTQGVDASVFSGPSGPRMLYLITCGGAFDAAEESYVDNIYVRARPVREV